MSNKPNFNNCVNCNKKTETILEKTLGLCKDHVSEEFNFDLQKCYTYHADCIVVRKVEHATMNLTKKNIELYTLECEFDHSNSVIVFSSGEKN